MVIPLFVGRPKSIKALEAAMEAGQQHHAGRPEGRRQGRARRADDMFEVGCVSTILQMLKLPDGTVKVLVEGTQRARIDEHHRQRRRTSSPTSTPVDAGEPTTSPPRSRRCAAR